MMHFLVITTLCSITAICSINTARIITEAIARSHQSRALPQDYSTEFQYELHRRSLYFQASLEAEIRKRYESSMEKRYRK